MNEAGQAVARLLDVRTGKAQSLGGAWRVTLVDGGSVVAKRGAPGQAASEAAGLRWLAEADGPPVPAVLGHDEDWLVIEDAGSGQVDLDAARDFGSRLATLHAGGADAFGAPPPGSGEKAWIGTAAMRNVPATDWPGWFAEQRVLPYLRAAVDRGALVEGDIRSIEQVCDRIEDLAGPAEPVSRLHGDLWSGNVHHAGDGRIWLLDPAAHGGHRETDLAMLELFGTPGLREILATYQEAAPLADGWRARFPLHQLFPLLVHAVLFGGGYGRLAGEAARSALG